MRGQVLSGLENFAVRTHYPCRRNFAQAGCADEPMTNNVSQESRHASGLGRRPSGWAKEPAVMPVFLFL